MKNKEYRWEREREIEKGGLYCQEQARNICLYVCNGRLPNRMCVFAITRGFESFIWGRKLRKGDLPDSLARLLEREQGDKRKEGLFSPLREPEQPVSCRLTPRTVPVNYSYGPRLLIMSFCREDSCLLVTLISILLKRSWIDLRKQVGTRPSVQSRTCPESLCWQSVFNLADGNEKTLSGVFLLHREERLLMHRLRGWKHTCGSSEVLVNTHSWLIHGSRFDFTWRMIPS